MRPSGKVNPIMMLIVAGVAGGFYWLATFGGVYLDNMDVKEAVSAAHGQWGIRSEAAVRQMILERVNKTQVGWHWQTNEFGEDIKVGGLGLDDDNIEVDADEPTRTLTLRVTYDREVEMKPFKKKKIVHFVVEKVGPFAR